MLLNAFLKEGQASLEYLYPTAEAKNIVLMLCEAVIGTKNYTHIVEPEYTIDESRMPSLRSALDRLAGGEPIQYVIGRVDFCGLRFTVNHDVLIPRPETELMVREAIKIGSRIKRSRIPYGKSAEPVRILDLCTGSGNIAWTVAIRIPGSKVVALDISEGALAVARSQNFSAELKEAGALAPTFLQADILDTEQDFNFGQFDMILSNPPYIMESEKPGLRRNVVDYEPEGALFVPDDDALKYYRAVAAWSQRFLAPEGKCLTEINELLGRETEVVFREAGFGTTEIIKDFYDKNRFIFYAK